MLLMRKRQIVIVALSVMIVIAAYLNWAYSGSFDETLPASGTAQQGEEAKRYGEAQFVNAGSESIESPAPSESAQPSQSGSNYFGDARINRDKSRSESLEILREVVDNANSSKDEVSQAQQKMTSIADAVEKESSIENLVKAKGFAEAVAFITDDSISITVATTGLSPSDTAKIKDIVVGQTNVSPDKIKIIEIK